MYLKLSLKEVVKCGTAVGLNHGEGTDSHLEPPLRFLCAAARVCGRMCSNVCVQQHACVAGASAVS